LEKIQATSFLISFTALSVGLLLQLPCSATCGQGAHLPGPANLGSAGIPAACPAEPRPPLGALAEASEVSGIAPPGGAGYLILKQSPHMLLTAQRPVPVEYTAAGTAPSEPRAAGTACTWGSPC